MHKSWGNAIEFDEAADRMGVDVMRWMFAKARPEENILFGWHAADEARRELLVLWNVYAFFVTYARLAGWTPAGDGAAGRRARPSSTAGSCRARRAPRPTVEDRLRDVDAVGATRALSAFIDDLSTWYLRLSRRRFSRSDDVADRDAAFATLHEALVADLPDARADPAVPGRDDVREPRGRRGRGRAGQRPPDALADGRAGRPPRRRRWRRRWRSPSAPSTWPGRCAAPRGSRPASRWRRPGSPCPTADSRSDAELLALDRRRDQRQGRHGHRRRVRPRRAAGQAAPAEDRQAPRVGDPGGHGGGPRRRRAVRAGRVGDAWPASPSARTRSRSRPRPGRGRPWPTHDGLVVVLDTELTPELRGRGRRPRAPARHPGPAPRGGPRARRPVDLWVRRRRGRARRRTCPRSRPRRWPRSSTATRRTAWRRATVELDGRAGRDRVAPAAPVAR